MFLVLLLLQFLSILLLFCVKLLLLLLIFSVCLGTSYLLEWGVPVAEAPWGGLPCWGGNCSPVRWSARYCLRYGGPRMIRPSCLLGRYDTAVPKWPRFRRRSD
jgi:hypothetical protein